MIDTKPTDTAADRANRNCLKFFIANTGKTFWMVEYENELDLLAIVEVTHREDEGKAHVRLHDNNTGALLKRVPQVESWDVTYSYKLLFDRDTILHIEQIKNNNFCCHVYKIISRGQADE